MNWAKRFIKEDCYSVICVLILLMGCANHTNIVKEDKKAGNQNVGEDEKMSINIQIKDMNYHAEIDDNIIVKELLEMLPLTLSMQHLNDQEVYGYLTEDLSASNDYTGAIHAGDIMLFNDRCLVLFYEDFTTSYRYTRIGHISSAENLREVLADDLIDITFSLDQRGYSK